MRVVFPQARGLGPRDLDVSVPFANGSWGKRTWRSAAGQVAEPRRASAAVIACPPPQQVCVLLGERRGQRPVGDDDQHDFRVDLIVTPERVIECGPAKRPGGLSWDRLPPDKIGAIPVLAQMSRMRR